jgi:hypothetical protein
MIKKHSWCCYREAGGELSAMVGMSTGLSKASRQRTAIEHPTTGTTFSSAQVLSHLSGRLEPLTHCWAHREDEGAHSENHACNPCRGGCNDQEMRSHSLEGPGPKALGSNVCDTGFPKHFWVPNNIIMYDDKTNPSMWLEDYHLACRVGGVDDDLFII